MSEFLTLGRNEGYEGCDDEGVKEMEETMEVFDTVEGAAEQAPEQTPEQAEIPAVGAREETHPDRGAAIDEFLERFPDVEPSGIPQSVWQKFLQGESLALAWAMHCNEVLHSRVEQLQRQEDNRRRTPGSLGSTTPEPDELDKLWAED